MKTSKTNKKTVGKRVHHRELFMAVNPKGGAMTNLTQLPAYWRKGLAKKAAKGGKVVRAELRWQVA